jgi:HAE1 family hydrophobic/amphiphilic exporter-1
MTSLATVLGLIPMAIGLSGESTQAPLALAVIGGLTFSTTLTLFFIPILYTIFEERFKREIRSDDDVQTEGLLITDQIEANTEQPPVGETPSTQKRRNS